MHGGNASAADAVALRSREASTSRAIRAALSSRGSRAWPAAGVPQSLEARASRAVHAQLLPLFENGRLRSAARYPPPKANATAQGMPHAARLCSGASRFAQSEGERLGEAAASAAADALQTRWACRSYSASALLLPSPREDGVVRQPSIFRCRSESQSREASTQRAYRAKFFPSQNLLCAGIAARQQNPLLPVHSKLFAITRGEHVACRSRSALTIV